MIFVIFQCAQSAELKRQNVENLAKLKEEVEAAEGIDKRTYDWLQGLIHLSTTDTVVDLSLIHISEPTRPY